MELGKLVKAYTDERKRLYRSMPKEVADVMAFIENAPDDVVVLSVDNHLDDSMIQVRFLATWNGKQFHMTFWTNTKDVFISAKSVRYDGMTPEEFWKNKEVISGVWVMAGGE